ncbi:hypothetical protein BG015_011896 [Linnemannia schmuckeri]|uniref:KN homeodomain domain-containing protein n=1 Tax=Linnemannia schmuckeri TaxID=64567 RepID=A0A9P5RSD1_9FUNG|nr:hypothetical protein BG015_011896 [Linnemannia schmuckeri]
MSACSNASLVFIQYFEKAVRQAYILAQEEDVIKGLIKRRGNSKILTGALGDRLCVACLTELNRDNAYFMRGRTLKEPLTVGPRCRDFDDKMHWINCNRDPVPKIKWKRRVSSKLANPEVIVTPPIAFAAVATTGGHHNFHIRSTDPAAAAPTTSSTTHAGPSGGASSSSTHADPNIQNAIHSYPTEEEKMRLSEATQLSMNQINFAACPTEKFSVDRVYFYKEGTSFPYCGPGQTLVASSQFANSSFLDMRVSERVAKLDKIEVDQPTSIP